MELTRGVSSSLMAALAADVIHPVVLVYLDWPGGAVRCHSGTGTITWSGHDWLGVGDVGSISVPEEASGMAVAEAMLSLVAPLGEVFDALEAPIHGHDGAIYMGCVTTRAGNVLVGDPVGLYAGTMDSARATVAADGDSLTDAIEISLTSGPGARSIASIYHTAEDQARLYPGDTAGRHVIHALARQEAQRWPAR